MSEKILRTHRFIAAAIDHSDLARRTWLVAEQLGILLPSLSDDHDYQHLSNQCRKSGFLEMALYLETAHRRNWVLCARQKD